MFITVIRLFGLMWLLGLAWDMLAFFTISTRKNIFQFMYQTSQGPFKMQPFFYVGTIC